MRFRCFTLLHSLLIPTARAAPPVAEDDTFSTTEDVAIVRTAAAGLRANDAAGTATEPAAGLVTSPAHGTLTLSPDGAFTFVPAADFSGADSFLYQVFGDRSVTAFTIDEPNSTLTVSATLRITFQGLPSISSDSSTSNITGTLAAAIAPNAAPFSVVRVMDMDAVR